MITNGKFFGKSMIIFENYPDISRKKRFGNDYLHCARLYVQYAQKLKRK